MQAFNDNTQLLSKLCKIPRLINNKSISEAKIMVAMSGGVDSSTVAASLHVLGYQVIGVTLQLYRSDKRNNPCCSGEEISDAKKVAQQMGFKHYTLNYEKVFKQEVIDRFASSYLQGQTPLPCVYCNQTVKFRDLLKVAKDLKVDALATGHYIRRKEENNAVRMYTARDQNKDQSYFLFSTTMEQLKFLRFPLGDLYKHETREIADLLKLGIANKPESQDICFTNNYVQTIKKMHPKSMCKGNILNMHGQVIGEHDGIISYTIGQRKRIKISAPEALYVIKIDHEKNTITVGPKAALQRKILQVKEVNWLTTPRDKIRATVKLRSLHKRVKADIHLCDDVVNVILDEGEYGIAPGQACVFYDDEQVLGGGWIA